MNNHSATQFLSSILPGCKSQPIPSAEEWGGAERLVFWMPPFHPSRPVKGMMGPGG